MMLPPLIVDVRIHRPAGNDRRVWVPVFLLWPLLALLLGLVLCVTLVLDAVLLVLGARYHYYTRLTAGALQLLAETRGTTARIRTADDHVDVGIY